MAKYKVGNSFKTRTNKKTVKLKVLFIPPKDWLGIQYYLFERYEMDINGNGMDNMCVELMEETELAKYFILTER